MRPALLATCLLLLAPIIALMASASHVVMDTKLICKKARKMRGKLADICNEPAIIKLVELGASRGVSECGYQFRTRPWNCTMIRRSIRKILLKDTRETAFVNAITAAGVTYEITRACTTGDLVQCSCDKAKGGGGNPGAGRGPPGVSNPFPAGEWQWGGCDDNIRYGYKKSKEFMDARLRRRSDIKTLIKLHNHNAGRLAIKKNMLTECTCHGLSGSCTLKTCWVKMPTFREVGNRLKGKFDGASKVMASNDGKKFMSEDINIKPPGKTDLVYTEKSPDFCKPDHRTGSLGTQGRQCNATSPGVDGCKLLCCERGFSQKTINQTVNCMCRFKWCCDVTCETCVGKRVINTCH